VLLVLHSAEVLGLLSLFSGLDRSVNLLGRSFGLFGRFVILPHPQVTDLRARSEAKYNHTIS